MIDTQKIINFVENFMGEDNAALVSTVILLVAYLVVYPVLIMYVWNFVAKNLYPNDPQDMLEKRKMSYLTAFCIMLLLSFFI